MQLEKYTVIADGHHRVYKFLSEGPKGIINKMVQYQLLGGNLYNLAFGDWDEAEQKFNDTVRSNNHDREKILLTVALTIIDFMKYYPHSVIFAQGATPAKTRLYQMAINKNWNEIRELFIVQGIINGNIEPFQPFMNYEGFVVELRRIV